MAWAKICFTVFAKGVFNARRGDTIAVGQAWVKRDAVCALRIDTRKSHKGWSPDLGAREKRCDDPRYKGQAPSSSRSMPWPLAPSRARFLNYSPAQIHALYPFRKTVG